MRANAGTIKVRCEGITAAGVQCRCWVVMRVNAIAYCKQHGEKELRKGEPPQKMRFSETKNPKKFDRDKIRWVK